MGDSYMTVGGIPDYSREHCEIVCHVALGMIWEARFVQDPVSKKPLHVRIGIHTGPIVAGVVGAKMPRLVPVICRSPGNRDGNVPGTASSETPSTLPHVWRQPPSQAEFTLVRRHTRELEKEEDSGQCRFSHGALRVPGAR